MGLNFYDYDVLQPKLTPPKHFNRQCNTIYNDLKVWLFTGAPDHREGMGELLLRKELKDKYFSDLPKNLKTHIGPLSKYFKDRKVERITIKYINEVILDISRNLNTINIILIDEMGIDDFEEDGENSMKSDWSKIDVSQPNSFLLVAFNPLGDSGGQSKFRIQTPTEMAHTQFGPKTSLAPHSLWPQGYCDPRHISA